MADALILPIVVTIGGVDRTTKVADSIYWSRVVNGIGQARFDTMDPTGSYAPVEGDPVVISLGGTVRWRGEVDAADTHFLGPTKGVLTHVTATYCAQYLQRDVINTTFVAGLQKTVLQALVASGTVLAALGVTLDAAQPDGATLTEIAAPYMTPEAILQYLSTVTGDIYDVSPSLVLGMWAPGAKSSGITITLGGGYLVDANWKRRRFDYRNREILSYGSPTTVQMIDETFIGNGSRRIFALHYVPATAPSSLTINDTPYPVGTYGTSGTVWTYRASDNSLYQDSGAPVLTSGQVLDVTLPVFFPQTVTYQDDAEIAANGPWARADSQPDVTTYAAAMAVAQGLVEQNKPKPPVPVVTITADGPLPGYTIVIDLPAIQLASQTCLIQQVETTCVKALDQADVQHTLTLVSGTTLVATPRDIWKLFLFGNQTASLGSGAGSGGLTAATAVTPLSVQLTATTTAYADNAVRGANVAGPVAEATRPRLNGSMLVGVGLQVRARVSSPDGGTVTLHLRDVTNNVDVGSSVATALTANTVTPITFRVVPSDGAAEYELWWEATAAPINLCPGPAFLETA
jgi:hypothetical protein